MFWYIVKKKDDPYLVIESKHSREKDDHHWVGESIYSGCEIARIDNLDEGQLECIFDVLKSAVSKYSKEREVSVSAGTEKFSPIKCFT